MKTFIFLIFCSLFLLMNNSFSQSCCDDDSAPRRMALMSDDKSFADAHPNPEEFSLTDRGFTSDSIKPAIISATSLFR